MAYDCGSRANLLSFDRVRESCCASVVFCQCDFPTILPVVGHSARAVMRNFCFRVGKTPKLLESSIAAMCDT